MKDIDKTKQNIRINEIDDNQRKDLFNKFKDAGGQVLSEKEKKRNLIIDREKQKQYKRRLDEHYISKKIPSPARVVIAPKKNTPLYKTMQSSVFDRFRIRMRLRLLGITGLNTSFFKISFFRKFNDYYKPSLIQTQMIFLSLFKKDLTTGNRIIRSLDKIAPIYYELIEKTGDLYKQYLIDQILEGYINFPEVPQLLSEKKEFYIELFRLLYLLKPYENSIYNSFDKSIDLYCSYLEEKKDKIIRKKDLKNSLFIIFDKLYPRLHTLFCHYRGILFSEDDSAIEDLLAIIPSEKPGNRVRISENRPAPFVDDIIKEEDSTSEKVPENLIVNDAVKEGLKLMYSLDNKTLRKVYDKKGEFELLKNTDKVLLSYLLFMEFEKEYSFILTTNQIKYNIDFSSYSKIDYRSKMQDIYNNLNKCRDNFKLYYEAFLEYNKIVNEKPLNNEQYIPYSKRLDEIIKKMKNIGSMSRLVIKSFMDTLSAELNNLLEDINDRQRYISNPQDILQFSYGIEGDKKLNNKKIYEAIEMIYNYVSALSYRIGPDGDLSGALEFDENEMQSELKEPEESNESEDKKKDQSGDSIFTELDDII